MIWWSLAFSSIALIPPGWSDSSQAYHRACHPARYGWSRIFPFPNVGRLVGVRGQSLDYSIYSSVSQRACAPAGWQIPRHTLLHVAGGARHGANWIGVWWLVRNGNYMTPSRHPGPNDRN